MLEDRAIQKELADIYVRFEDGSDELPGEDANMMRLERFMSWDTSDGGS